MAGPEPFSAKTSNGTWAPNGSWHPFEFAQDAPLEVDGAHRVGVGEVGHKFEARVVRAHLQGQGALGQGRHKDHGVEDVHMQVGQVEVQPLHACMGQHDGVVLATPEACGCASERCREVPRP